MKYCKETENKHSKKVCIIRSNPVRPDSRVEKEALALTKGGYDVTILAWDRDGNHPPTDESILVANRSIRIVRLGFKATFGEGFKNILPYLKFQFAVRKFLRKNRFDVVHACDFDTAYFCYRMVKMKKEKFVFDIFDFLYGEPKNLLQRLVKRAEIRIINRSDSVIICTEERKKQIEGSSPKDLVVIHNSPSREQLPESIKDLNLNKAKIKICYVGILHKNGRLLDEIGRFVVEHNNFELHVGGFGPFSDYFKDLSLRHDNVKFYGRIPYSQTLELESNCDLMLALYDPSIENHVFAAPNKFYEALFLGKPLLMVKNTGMSNVVSDNGFGALIDYSYEGLVNGFNQIVDMIPEWNKISDEMKKLYWAKYDWQIMERRLIDLYDRITN